MLVSDCTARVPLESITGLAVRSVNSHFAVDPSCFAYVVASSGHALIFQVPSFIAIDLVYKNNFGVLFMFHLKKYIILYYLKPLKCLLQEINFSR